MDDGGFLIDGILNDLDLKDRVIGATELTSSGFTKLKDKNIPFPVINIARSKTKLEIEGEMIAELEVKHVLLTLKKYNLQAKNIAIIGGGAIGKKIHKILLSRDFNSHIYDVDSNLRTINSLEEVIRNADIIIGATGSNPISLDILKSIKHKCFLISVSSSDREFPSAEIRRSFQQNSDSHKDYEFGNLVLINSGFPVNFTGEILSLPREEVQLTDSLIQAAVFQARQIENKTGFVELNKTYQENILQKFLELEPRWNSNKKNEI